MKKLYFCLLVVLLSMNLISCGNKEDSYPPFIYDYYLAFVDENDKDLIEGISTSSDISGRLMLRDGTYVYKMVKPASKDGFTEPDYIYINRIDGRHNVLEIFDMLWEAYRYDNKPEVLTRTLACPYIFGDEKEHSIVSYWKYDDSCGGIELIRITIDGKDAHIEAEGDKSLVIAVLKK